MKKYISATKGQREHLMKVLGCGDRMVRDALTFRSDTKLAKKLRFTAKQIGCPTYAIGLEMECFFDSDGAMHQVFPNGAEIEVDKEAGNVSIIYKSEVVAKYENIKLSEISAIQKRAEAL